jgi:hypothetical protein
MPRLSCQNNRLTVSSSVYYNTDLTYLKTHVTDRDSGDVRRVDSVGVCLGILLEVPLGVLLGGSTGG